jgi:drug/metabolite transporter (DMT)-like permease
MALLLSKAGNSEAWHDADRGGRAITHFYSSFATPPAPSAPADSGCRTFPTKLSANVLWSYNVERICTLDLLYTYLARSNQPVSPANLALILASAVVHVVAHVALKRARDRTAFAWWMLLWGSLLFSPVVLWRPQAVSLLAIGIMAVSAVVEVLYLFAITRAYQLGDLSVVYPLARGTAPLFLLLWTTLWPLSVADRIRPGGVGGIALIALGLYIINLPRLGAWTQPLRALVHGAPRWALLAGLCISLYTLIDRTGIQLLDPLFYTDLVLWLTWLVFTPLAVRLVGWDGLREEIRSSGLSSVLAGFTTLAAYAMVLYAIRAGTPASYAGAVREVSVVFAGIVGIVFLKERGSAVRPLGALCVFLGISLIALLA